MNADSSLEIWISDAAEWWRDSAQHALGQAGHSIRTFPSADELLAATRGDAGPPPNVVLFGCGSVTPATLATMRCLASREWAVVVAPGGVGVSAICEIFATGVTAIAERYAPARSLVETVEAANQFSRKESVRRLAWSAQP